MKQALSAALLAIAVSAQYDSYSPDYRSSSYSASPYTSSYQPRSNNYSSYAADSYSAPYGAPADYEEEYSRYQPYGTGYSQYDRYNDSSRYNQYQAPAEYEGEEGEDSGDESDGYPAINPERYSRYGGGYFHYAAPYGGPEGYEVPYGPNNKYYQDPYELAPYDDRYNERGLTRWPKYKLDYGFKGNTPFDYWMRRWHGDRGYYEVPRFVYQRRRFNNRGYGNFNQKYDGTHGNYRGPILPSYDVSKYGHREGVSTYSRPAPYKAEPTTNYQQGTPQPAYQPETATYEQPPTNSYSTISQPTVSYEQPAYTAYAPSTSNYTQYAPTNTYQSSGYTNVYSQSTADADTTAVEGLTSADAYLEQLAAEAEQAEREAFMAKYERATPEATVTVEPEAILTVEPVDITV